MPDEQQPQPGFIDRGAILLATWFGSGLLPVAPGTWGTLAAIPLVALLSWGLHSWVYLLSVVLITALSIPIADRAAVLCQQYPRFARLNPHRDTAGTPVAHFVKDAAGQEKDPGMIVIDEVAGYAAAMLFVPFSLSALGVAFILFRILDIYKPQPGKLLEGIGGGAGIVLDDISSGLYACLGTHLFLWAAASLNITALP